MLRLLSRRNAALFLVSMSYLATVSLFGSNSCQAADKEVVTLTVDFGDGLQKKFTALPWKEGMTVADALDAAQKHPRGIKIVKRGSGETTLLTQIDDLKNGQMERYWIYEVNGREGDQSYALIKLKSGDSVLWRFDIYK